MRDDTYHEDTEYKGYTIRIELDADGADNPRDNDNLCTMVCWHRRSSLGDTTVGEANGRKEKDKPFFYTFEGLRRFLHQKNVFYMPLYLYEHSGMTMWTNGQDRIAVDWGFDSGQVGFIYVEKKDVLENWGRKRMSKKLKAQVYDLMRAEVKEYDQWLTGDIWGFNIYEPDLEEIDKADSLESVWGFFGKDYCLEEAKRTVDWLDKQRQEEAWKHLLSAPVENVG